MAGQNIKHNLDSLYVFLITALVNYVLAIIKTIGYSLSTVYKGCLVSTKLASSFIIYQFTVHFPHNIYTVILNVILLKRSREHNMAAGSNTINNVTYLKDKI